MEIVTSSQEETIELASEIATKLKGGEILALTGELGAGKTVFSKGLAKALGVEANVISPTFNLVKSYKIEKKDSNIKQFLHADLYRLNSREEAIDIGFLDDFSKEDTICLIEWADKFKNIFPEQTVWVEIEHIENDKRKITIKGLE